MQKLSIFKTITIFIISTIIPIIGMEQSLATSEKPKFVVRLDLYETKREDIKDEWNKCFNQADAHACKVLGIAWQKNKNIYFIDRAGVRKCDETKYSNWKDNYINTLPLSTIPDMSKEKEYQYLIKFPKSLPAAFVERLEKEKSIILENTQFAEPVEIIIELGKLKKLKKITEEDSSTES